MSGEIEFQLEMGTAKAVVDALVASLEKGGWKAEPASENSKTAGLIALTKGEIQVAVQYIDPGTVVAAQVTISDRGVDLKRIE